ncbi:hypothetical protein [Clostridium intestinale]|uniref:hypothetical protein n=1 Tax=Clostridium intestinale TaxID=36845 RepID=UPI002DD64E48|nr:hypothetical protein [Clostridium intestinale]WRY52826.1 hypothetical protein P8F83_06400 [Clostridium intestinale]
MQNKIFKIVSRTLCIPIILFLLNGCNLNKSDGVETTVDAKVVENNLYNKQLVVSGIDNSSISQIGDNCIISCKDIKIFNKSGEEISQDSIMADNIVTIMYDWHVQETYPTTITNSKWIQIRE